MLITEHTRRDHATWQEKLVQQISVDPHNMGYIPYPCGVVAFRDDRTRRFIAQNAP
ncbi:MAG: hypothetical protein JXA30_11210 [Deltaproteobacteria bacterium]|nr:hypothetical protein [Deltaproteobacteria bacterium]